MQAENIQTREYPLTTKLLIACGAIGPLLFILVFLVEGATRPGYSAWHNFVTDPSLGYYPPGTSSSTHTLHGTIHGANAPLAFGSLTIAIFMLARRFASDRQWRGWALYSLVSGILLVGFFIACLHSRFIPLLRHPPQDMLTAHKLLSNGAAKPSSDQFTRW